MSHERQWTILFHSSNVNGVKCKCQPCRGISGKVPEAGLVFTHNFSWHVGAFWQKIKIKNTRKQIKTISLCHITVHRNDFKFRATWRHARSGLVGHVLWKRDTCAFWEGQTVSKEHSQGSSMHMCECLFLYALSGVTLRAFEVWKKEKPRRFKRCSSRRLRVKGGGIEGKDKDMLKTGETKSLRDGTGSKTLFFFNIVTEVRMGAWATCTKIHFKCKCFILFWGSFHPTLFDKIPACSSLSSFPSYLYIFV